MKILTLTSFLTAVISAAANSSELYAGLDGQSVYRCFVKKSDQPSFEALLSANNDCHPHSRCLDLWSRQPTERDDELQYDIMADKGALHSWPCFEWIADPKFLFENQNDVIGNTSTHSRYLYIGNDNEFFSKYRTYDEIVQHVNKLVTAYPQLATLDSIGLSTEGRNIPVVKITGSKTNAMATAKRTIWMNGGQHAREWVGPSSNLFILTNLLNKYGSDDAITAAMDTFIFTIAPILNPDGYEFSRTNYRMWRKNRRVNNDRSFGVDLNRNWDDHWGLVGASRQPSSDTYMGPSPASEPEVKQTQNYIERNLVNPVAGIDFHSYGQLVLRNWGYTYDVAPHEAEIKPLGDGMRDAIKAATGATYKSMRSAELYPTGGSTDDWFYNSGSMYGFTIELRDTGRYGFAVPASYIIPTGQDALAAVLGLARALPPATADSNSNSNSNRNSKIVRGGFSLNFQQ